MCVTLLTSAGDDDRYVTVVKLDETTTGRYVFIFATAQDNISCNSKRKYFQLSRVL